MLLTLFAANCVNVELAVAKLCAHPAPAIMPVTNIAAPPIHNPVKIFTVRDAKNFAIRSIRLSSPRPGMYA